MWCQNGTCLGGCCILTTTTSFVGRKDRAGVARARPDRARLATDRRRRHRFRRAVAGTGFAARLTPIGEGAAIGLLSATGALATVLGQCHCAPGSAGARLSGGAVSRAAGHGRCDSDRARWRAAEGPGCARTSVDRMSVPRRCTADHAADRSLPRRAGRPSPGFRPTRFVDTVITGWRPPWSNQR